MNRRFRRFVRRKDLLGVFVNQKTFRSIQVDLVQIYALPTAMDYPFEYVFRIRHKPSHDLNRPSAGYQLDNEDHESNYEQYVNEISNRGTRESESQSPQNQ